VIWQEEECRFNTGNKLKFFYQDKKETDEALFMGHRLRKYRVSDQWASVLLSRRFSVAVSNTCGVTVAGLEPDLKEGWLL